MAYLLFRDSEHEYCDINVERPVPEFGPGVILAVADPAYFMRYAPALIASAHSKGVPLHIEIVTCRADPLTREEEYAWRETSFILERANKHYIGKGVSCDVSSFDLDDPSPHRLRVFYACARAIVAARIARQCAREGRNLSMFLLDIDSIVNRPFLFPQSDLCFFKTDPKTSGAQNEIEHRGMHLLASCIIRTTASEYLDDVVQTIRAEKFGYWFLDQIAYWEALDRHLELSFEQMNGLGILDSENFEEGAIWSGRGNRKFTDPVYLSRQARYRDMFWGRD